ncbi:hypothetical protein HK405_012985, partial [Cladochytrium tenue]
ERRVAADAEWSSILAAERSARVEKARLMQYVATNPVRQLHSRMLQSNVLHERQLQRTHKARQDAQARLSDDARSRAARPLLDASFDREEARPARDRARNVAVAHHQLADVAAKAADAARERE